MKHVFLTDIDGTLLRRDAPMTQEVIDAAHSFVFAGGLLSVCTGRSLPSVRQVTRAIGVNAPCILYGGAAIYDFAQEAYLYHQPFRWDILQAVQNVLHECPDVSMQVFTVEDVYVLRRNKRLNTLGVAEENLAPLASIHDVRGDVLKLVMCCDEPAHLEACRQFFPPEYCHFAFASRTFVDVVASGSGKGEAMQRLSELLAIPFSRFFSAGDANTDLPMLRTSAISFAPENALDAVKASVTHIIPSVHDGGMAQAFRIAANHLSVSQEG